MSKPKPPRDAAAPPPAPVTPESPHMAILLERNRIHDEILRHRAYRDLLELRAELAELPPPPSSHDTPANED